MKESMIKETKALRESLQMARAKAEKLDLDNRELEKIAEVGILLLHTDQSTHLSIVTLSSIVHCNYLPAYRFRDGLHSQINKQRKSDDCFQRTLLLCGKECVACN